MQKGKKNNNINNKTSRALEHTRKPVGVVVVVVVVAERNPLGRTVQYFCACKSSVHETFEENTSVKIIFFYAHNFNELFLRTVSSTRTVFRVGKHWVLRVTNNRRPEIR